MPRVRYAVGCGLPHAHCHACMYTDLWFAEADTSTDTIKSEAPTPEKTERPDKSTAQQIIISESMYTEDQIRKAADGKTEGAGGLNVPELLMFCGDTRKSFPAS